MEKGNEDCFYIGCVGVDNRRHICKPHENYCKCGVKVKSKKEDRNQDSMLSCYECTY